MFHARTALLAARRTGAGGVKLFGLLSLHGLVEFGGGELANFVAKFFDLVPRQLDRRTVFTVGLGTDHPSELLHLLKDLGRKSGTTFFDSF
jgi:hypothetical protein